jgi:plastocyanin
MGGGTIMSGRTARTSTVVAVVLAVMLLVPAGIALAGGGVTCIESGGSEPAGADTVILRDACFTPAILRVEPGTTVTWENEDGFEHVVASEGHSWGDTAELAGPKVLQLGDSVSHRFDSPGVYPYACYLHPGMVGAVVVDDAGGDRTVEAIVPGSEQGPGPTSAPTTSAGIGPWVAAAVVVIVVLLGATLLAIRRGRSRSPAAPA